MGDDEFVVDNFDPMWRHVAAATRRTITGRVINMHAPQTVWAMVCVPVSDNLTAAMMADKGLR